MTTPPDKIYLQFYGDPEFWPAPDEPEPAEEVTWCRDKIHDPDIEYLRKDVVIEALKQVLARQVAFFGGLYFHDEYMDGVEDALELIEKM
jgi:hypothetical protein